MPAFCQRRRAETRGRKGNAVYSFGGGKEAKRNGVYALGGGRCNWVYGLGVGGGGSERLSHRLLVVDVGEQCQSFLTCTKQGHARHQAEAITFRAKLTMTWREDVNARD